MKWVTGGANRDLPSRESLPRLWVQLASQTRDEILGTSVLPFGETLAYLIYHHARSTVLFQLTEQVLLGDRELDPS
jgi:hypothetical protein